MENRSPKLSVFAQVSATGVDVSQYASIYGRGPTFSTVLKISSTEELW